MAVKTEGLFWGYETKVTITGPGLKLIVNDTGNVQFELNSSDKSTASRSKVTLYNIDEDKINRIKKGFTVVVESGPADLYGIAGQGSIIKIESNYDGGKDKTTVLTFTQSSSYNSDTLDPNFNGGSTVKVTETKGKTTKSKSGKTKKTKTKINMSFKGRQHAKNIIKKIAAASGINLAHVKLAKDKIYKRGYTVSNRPYQAIVSIVKDCGSIIYTRNDGLVIDDYSTDNPYHEHIYFELGSGLLSEPSVYDRITTASEKKSKNKNASKQCYVLDCFDDPRVQAGSCVQVKSKTVNGLHRVQSVKHTHSGNYEMQVVVYQ